MRYSRKEMQIMLGAGLIAGLFFLAWVTMAAAESKYKIPDLSDYYASLMQPDNPRMSCCGAGDAYYAEAVPCTVDESLMPGGCQLVAVITDTRPNEFTIANGKVIKRRPIAVGTRYIVPPNKIRKRPIPNPTDQNIVFISNFDGVLCWEPQSGL